MLKRSLIASFLASATLLVACSTGAAGGQEDAAAAPVEDASETVATTHPPVPAPSSPSDTEGGLIVQDGDTVEVHYDGTLDDGSTFDSSRERGTPFSFAVGTGQVIPGFDEAVRGLKVGESREVRIPPGDAYGERSDENIIEVPLGTEQGDVAVGDEVYLNNGRPAIVLEVRAGTVVLDTNHPLAGEALTFEIEVLSITRP